MKRLYTKLLAAFCIFLTSICFIIGAFCIYDLFSSENTEEQLIGGWAIIGFIGILGSLLIYIAVKINSKILKGTLKQNADEYNEIDLCNTIVDRQPTYSEPNYFENPGSTVLFFIDRSITFYHIIYIAFLIFCLSYCSPTEDDFIDAGIIITFYGLSVFASIYVAINGIHEYRSRSDNAAEIEILKLTVSKGGLAALTDIRAKVEYSDNTINNALKNLSTLGFGRTQTNRLGNLIFSIDDFNQVVKKPFLKKLKILMDDVILIGYSLVTLVCLILFVWALNDFFSHNAIKYGAKTLKFLIVMFFMTGLAGVNIILFNCRKILKTERLEKLKYFLFHNATRE